MHCNVLTIMNVMKFTVIAIRYLRSCIAMENVTCSCNYEYHNIEEKI